jgi:putative ABC transport system ATP-binding protein
MKTQLPVNEDIALYTKALTKQVDSEGKALQILEPIDMTVKSGETVAIIGSSGSGRTTLLSILAGLDGPSTGQVYLKGHPLHQLNEEQRAKVRADHVGFIFQSFLLINSLTALENVMLPAELVNDPQAKQKARQLLMEVGLGDRGDHFPAQLSGGEQQRVAIARAFICQPQLLFADEPTGNLDSKTGEHIAHLLFKLNRLHGTTLVLVTHDSQLAERCHRQLIMSGGQLSEASGAPQVPPGAVIS